MRKIIHSSFLNKELKKRVLLIRLSTWSVVAVISLILPAVSSPARSILTF
jgi:hypothetical protein